MATGDDALAAGMDIITTSTDLVKDGGTEINKTRDYIAQQAGGTVAIANGGTGATTASAARSALGANDADNLTTGTLPAARLPDHQHTISGGNGVIGLGDALDDKADDDYVKNRVAASPASQQPLYNPYGRANPVSTSWVAAALNSDGRLGIQPSSIRFKTILGDYEGSALELHPVLYVLNADENEEQRAGFVAEQVAEHLPHGVVLDSDGQPLALQLDAIVAALVLDVQRLTARIAELEGHES